MKKYFPYILILIVTVGIFFPTHFAHAWPWDSFAPDGIFQLLLSSIVEGILRLLSWVLWLAGVLLNFVIRYTILDMSAVINGGTGSDGVTVYKGLTGINIAWKILRDLMNIAFIFLLVYEGIKLILNMGSINSIKNFIFGVVLASLLINFSLFFTKVLIDASNVITIGIHDAIVKPSVVPPSGSPSANFGLSDKIMDGLGLQTIYGVSGQNKSFSGGKDIGQTLIMGLGSGLIILIAAFVFFAVAMMLIIRYLILIFLLMLSPIAYMGMAFPSLKSYSNEWWESLKGQLLFPPIFMVMMLLVLTLMTSDGFITKSYFDQIFNGSGTEPDFGTMSLLVNFAVIIGLLIASLVTSKKFASLGSKHIGAATKSLTAFAGGAALGGAARIGRNTLGRAGNSYANNQDLLDRAARGDIGARLQLAAANKAATSTFDARGSSGFKTLSKQTGVDLGKVDPKKDNFRKIREEQIKSDVEDAKKYKPSDIAVEQAKAKLKPDTEEGRKFADEEAERKRAHDIYVESDKYKESAEAKRLEKDKADSLADKAKLEAKKAEIAAKKAEIDNMRRVADLQRNNPVNKEKVDAQIREEEKKLSRQQDESRDLDALVKSRDKAIETTEFERDNFMSEEKKKLIALSGGTKYDKQKKAMVDGAGNVVEDNRKISSTYTQRTEARAQREEVGPIWRWSANIVGTPASGILPIKPKTKADRSETARQIRKLAAEKSTKDKLAEVVKDYQKETEEAETPAAAPATPAAPAADAPAPADTTPPATT